MAAFASMVIEANITAGWTDITADVIVDPIRVKWGINGNSAVDLIASTGTFRFTMDNNSGEYLPGLTTSVAGWNVNTAVRIVFTFEGVPYIKFRGYVSTIRNLKRRKNEDRVFVTCVDYIGYMAKSPLINPSTGTDKRADEALTTLLTTMPIQPQATSFETGQETFDTVFSTVTPNTKAYSEAAKLVRSEFGHFYRQADKTGGETLVFEDRHFRNGLRTLSLTQVSDGSALLLETGGYLLLETGGKLLLNKTEDTVMDNNMVSVEIEYGQDIVNHFKTIAYPKGISGANEVLFNLEKPIILPPGQSVTFRTNYTDPTGGNQINAVSSLMVTPVATTDYLMNSEEGGGGSDLTGNLTVTANYGTEGVIYTLTNGDALTGYVTFLQARGIGIFAYNPISDEEENITSQEDFGYYTQTLTQPYQQTLALGKVIGQTVVNAEKRPRINLKKVSFAANRSAALMHSFLDLKVGDIIRIKEDEAEIDGYYYIQGVEFVINLSGMIRFTWTVVLMLSLISGGLTPVDIEFTGTGSKDAINFGYVPHLSDLPARSLSAWVYLDEFDEFGAVIGIWSDSASFMLRVTQSHEAPVFTVKYAPGQQEWRGPLNSVSSGGLTHLVVTKDGTSDDDPLFYINGSLVATTLNSAPIATSSPNSEVGSSFMIGNVKTETIDYGWGIDALIADGRVYNKVINQTDVTALYNGGDPDTSVVTDGLIFQAPTVKTVDYAGLLNTGLTHEDKIIDNIFGIVGTPIDACVVRVFP